MTEIYDILIVGGGPAGLSAGIYGSRSRLKTVILSKGNLVAKRLLHRTWRTIPVFPGAPPARR